MTHGIPESDPRRDWLLAGLIALSLVGFPLVSTLPVALGLPSRPISAAFRAVVLGMSLLILLRWLSGRVRLASPLALGLMALCWAMLVARLGWDALGRQLPLPLPWDEFLVFLTLVSILPAMALLQLPGAATLRVALGLTELMGGLAIVGVGLLGAQALSDASAMSRLATETLNPVSMGHLALTVLIVCTFQLFTERPRRFWRTVLRVLGLLIAMLLMVATASKGPIVASLLIAMCAVAAQVIRQPSRVRILGSLAGVLVAVAILGATAFALEELTGLKTVSRFTEIQTDDSTFDRTRLLSGSISQFASSPLVGSDVVERVTRGYPHNLVLESVMVTGVVGFVPFLLLNLLGFAAGLWLLVWGGRAAWVALIYFQYLVAGMLSGSLIYGSHSWATLAMVIAAALPLRVLRLARPASGSAAPALGL